MYIYLDNSSLQKPKQEIVDLMNDIYISSWFNPNSIYQNGIESKKKIEQTKQLISNEINCNPEELIFCSCGSECNSLATCGYIRANNLDFFITSTIEHVSIAENPYSRKVITVDNYGFLNMDDIKNTHNSLVSIQMANSEIGTVQKNFKKIVEILHNNNCIVHTDAVALFGKEKIDVHELGVDMLTATAQKIGGIIGGAFLYKKDNIKLEPLIFGHNTERGGTPNVAAIASMGLALQSINYSSISSEIRDYVYNYIMNNIPDSYLIGAPIGDKRLPHNLYMCFKGVEGESLMMLLDMNGIEVSTGSACSSGSLQPSSALVAIGMNKEDIHSCIRMSFSGNETEFDIDYVCYKLKECVEKLRGLGDENE